MDFQPQTSRAILTIFEELLVSDCKLSPAHVRIRRLCTQKLEVVCKAAAPCISCKLWSKNSQCDPVLLPIAKNIWRLHALVGWSCCCGRNSCNNHLQSLRFSILTQKGHRFTKVFQHCHLSAPLDEFQIQESRSHVFEFVAGLVCNHILAPKCQGLAIVGWQYSPCCLIFTRLSLFGWPWAPATLRLTWQWATHHGCWLACCPTRNSQPR